MYPMIDQQTSFDMNDSQTVPGVTEVSEGPDSTLAPESQAASPSTSPSVEPIDAESVTASPVPENSQEAGTEEVSPELLLAAIAQERDTLAQQLDEQTQQVDALKQRYISLAAEFDNFRKRSAREKQDLEVQVKCKTLGELLGVVDNFERARTQLKPNSDGEMAIHKSYQSVYKSLVDGLKRLGVSPMRPEGQIFDPSYHEAMLREYSDEYPDGTVIEQLVRGYTLEDQVLRHAMVKVSAGSDPEATTNDPLPVTTETESSDESS